MRTNRKPKSVRWSPKAPQRITGYLSPLAIFVIAVVWMKPVNTIGWVAVSIPPTVAFLFIFIPIFTHARSEIARRTFDRESHETPKFMSWSQESRFRSPSGEVPMNDFLASQP